MPEIVGFTVQTAIVAGFVAGAVWVGIWSYRRHSAQSLAGRIRAHFRPFDWAQIKIVDRRFPFHMRADLQKALESILEGFQVSLVSSIAQQHAFAEITFPGIIASGSDYPLSLQFEEVDVGEDQPIQCLHSGVWLLRRGATPLAMLCAPIARCGDAPGIRVQVAAAGDDAGATITREIFDRLESAIAEARCYRGKILSFEIKDSYSGEQSGVTVHRLTPVVREQIILQPATLDLLQRNIINFVGQRPRLAAAGLPTKKGLLFYGPPGTGKTHTFILTTNRPESLEKALVSRPGRIDQAIEFPLPDAACRAKLVRLYACDMQLTDDVVKSIVERTDGVSASFIKELMRRSMQFQLERDGAGPVTVADVTGALDEMIIRGGSLNLKLLGAGGLAATGDRIVAE